jgi:hypothetical protein
MIITMVDLDPLVSGVEDALVRLEEARDEGDEDQASEAADDLREGCEQLSSAAMQILADAEIE